MQVKFIEWGKHFKSFYSSDRISFSISTLKIQEYATQLHRFRFLLRHIYFKTRRAKFIACCRHKIFFSFHAEKKWTFCTGWLWLVFPLKAKTMTVNVRLAQIEVCIRKIWVFARNIFTLKQNFEEKVTHLISYGKFKKKLNWFLSHFRAQLT